MYILMKKSAVLLILLSLLLSLLLLSSCAPEPEEDDELTYEEYWSMTGGEQRAYKESFADVEDFYAWYKRAREKYEADHPMTDVPDDGEVDLGG
ncbi:MAG: hypothetical protein IKC32_01575 [Clostridia bacterium]|nr:hypothetical protein [Clostridia bacterium]